MKKSLIEVKHSILEVHIESTWFKRNAFKIFIIVGVLLFVYYSTVLLNQNETITPEAFVTINYSHNFTMSVLEFQWIEEYLVKTSHCMMVSLNPYASDALTVYKKLSKRSCQSTSSVINVTYDQRGRVYTLNQTISEYICCYKEILRDESKSTMPADQRYKLVHCRFFFNSFVVPRHISGLITVCKRRYPKYTQMDAFSFVHPIKEVIVNDSSSVRKPSVLLWGLDSMSRMNLPRIMPILYNYLNEGYWYELRGYNKIGNNTFPNIMALLAGFNDTHSESICRPNEIGGLDACPLVWKDYKRQGYLTAYAEDWADYATFNNIFKGFQKPPTDVYLRNIIIALERELKDIYVSSIPYCLGGRYSAEYIYDSAMQFTQVYKDHPTFGIFWTNSFSHNNFAMHSALDEKIVEYMRKLCRNGIMENTIIIFFSDHGMQFGPLRKLKSGFLEERLPIMYLRIPNWFKQKYRKFVLNLELNRNRLTSPYDIYATLRHILELETPSELLPRPVACRTCHSVFEEISLLRNCSMAGISQHWCTCDQFVEVPTDNVTKNIAIQMINKINTFLDEIKHSDLCQKLVLSHINSAFMKSDLKTYRVQFITKPQAVPFEGTAQWNKSTELITIDVKTISRLDFYSKSNECASDQAAKKFCICFQ